MYTTMELRRFFFRDHALQRAPSEEIARLAEVAQKRSVPQGERLFAEGDDAGTTYAVMDGQVQITRSSSDGKPWTIEVLRARGNIWVRGVRCQRGIPLRRCRGVRRDRGGAPPSGGGPAFGKVSGV